MPPVFISEEDVTKLLDSKELFNALEAALGDFSRGEEGGVVQPVRSVVKVADHNGFLGAMPGYSQHDQALASKLVCFYPDNTDVPTHSAVILLFNPQNGVLQAIIDGEEITKTRTAMASAVATKYLASPSSKILAVIGSGVQAHSHVGALSMLFKFDEIRIYSRNKEKREKCAADVGGVACNSAQEAVKDADIIVTATFSQTPVLKKEWVKEGAHINAVGACTSTWQEIDPALMTSAVVYVDSREAALKESGDVILSQAEIYAEVGEVVSGQKKAYPQKTTVFKSLGMAIEDVVCAKLVYEAYRRSPQV